MRSPSLPTAGPTTAKASSGPVMTQVRVLSLVSRSSAIPGIDTARIVIVKVTVRRPNSVVARTTHGYQPLSSALS